MIGQAAILVLAASLVGDLSQRPFLPKEEVALQVGRAILGTEGPTATTYVRRVGDHWLVTGTRSAGVAPSTLVLDQWTGSVKAYRSHGTWDAARIAASLPSDGPFYAAHPGRWIRMVAQERRRSPSQRFALLLWLVQQTDGVAAHEILESRSMNGDCPFTETEWVELGVRLGSEPLVRMALRKAVKLKGMEQRAAIHSLRAAKGNARVQIDTESRSGRNPLFWNAYRTKPRPPSSPPARQIPVAKPFLPTEEVALKVGRAILDARQDTTYTSRGYTFEVKQVGRDWLVVGTPSPDDMFPGADSVHVILDGVNGGFKTSSARGTEGAVQIARSLPPTPPWRLRPTEGWATVLADGGISRLELLLWICREQDERTSREIVEWRKKNGDFPFTETEWIELGVRLGSEPLVRMALRKAVSLQGMELRSAILSLRAATGTALGQMDAERRSGRNPAFWKAYATLDRTKPLGPNKARMPRVVVNGVKSSTVYNRLDALFRRATMGRTA